MAAFKDDFSQQSAAYARLRPHYPPALFARLAALAPRRGLAWDCATGNGQAALGLARHFTDVVASDASAAQLREATAHPHIHYFAATAEQVPLASHSIDLIAVAQALHWFDRPMFYREVQRVLRPDGLFCAWTYATPRIDADVDPVIDDIYRNLLGKYWPAERRLVNRHYQTIDFPFLEISLPELHVEQNWNLPRLLGYLSSWSAVQRHRASEGDDPLPSIEAALRKVWPEPLAARTIRWPLYARCGRLRNRPRGTASPVQSLTSR